MKLRRAYYHTESLKKAIQTWRDSDPYALVREFDHQAGEYVVWVKELHPPPLLDWAVVIGDVLHNLRSALDHLICVMVKQQVPSHPCIGTEFPIFDDEAQWEVLRQGRLTPHCGLGKLGPADEWTIATVKRHQPFQGRKKASEYEPLWVLQKLNVVDKHRTLHIGATYLYEPEVIFHPPGGGKVVWVKPAGPSVGGDELLRYRLARGRCQGQVEVDAGFGSEIIFDEGAGPAAGTKVEVMLDWIFDVVVYNVDLFDQKFFGGRPPTGSMHTIVRGREAPVTTPVEGAHSNDPEAKKERWGGNAHQ